MELKLIEIALASLGSKHVDKYNLDTNIAVRLD